MPIVFQQPGPFSAEAAEGGGAAHQFSHDLPTLAAQQRTIAELYAQAHRGGGGGMRQAPAPPPLQEFGPGAGQNMQAPAFRQERQADPLTQAETLRLQRLQQGLAAVDEQVGNNMLTEEEGNQFRLMLRTGIDPLRQRMEAAQANALQQQTQQATHQHAQLTAWQNMAAEDRSSRLRNLVQTVTDDEGNELGTFFTDPVTGRITQTREARAQPTERGGVTPQLSATWYHQAEQAAMHEVQQARTAAMPGAMQDWMRNPEGIQGEIDRRHQARMRVAQAAGGTGAGSSRQRESQPPFERSNTEGMTELQRRAVQSFDALRSGMRVLPQTEQTRLRPKIDQAEQLLQRYGSEESMSTEDRQRFRNIMRELTEMAAVIGRWQPNPSEAPRSPGLRPSEYMPYGR